MPSRHRCSLAVGALVLLTAGVSTGSAQTTDAPFAGKTVQVIIGVSPGGGYDQWGRAFARHLGKHLPGKPAVVAQNMPGAGSTIAANYIYNIAPKDGTVIGIIARDTPLAPLTATEGTRFDATKFGWVGTPTVDTNVCIAYHTAAVKTLQDLYDKELIVGAVGTGVGSYNYPRALNRIIGTKFKVVTGFPGSADVFLAMERGDVEGFCESLDSVTGKRADWISTGKVALLFQGGAEANPELKDVPFILDAGRTAEERQAILFLYAAQGIGRPFLAPPGLPPQRLETLRAAFDATMRDEHFVADARKQKLDLAPKNGRQLAALIDTIYATPRAVVERVREAIK
jgi:tripartite-type tricarboxylate transporter receptor subunit TctC